MDYSNNQQARRSEWFRYYSEKRITHQWFQVHLLKDLPKINSILEIGPGLGLVSSMLHNVGYKITTVDYLPNQYPHPDIRYLQKEIMELTLDEISGYDCIICCETLEHLLWENVDNILTKFFESKCKWVLISVPYQGFQLDFRLYLNLYRFKKNFSLKIFKFLKNFKFDIGADPYGHKWEVGYKNYSLSKLEKKIKKTGFKIYKKEFSSPCRSVFFVLKNI
ncbi:MAG: hypothetical protein CFH01_01862 [Alphaproteobacteria bacterium MarineAlpha2_Bin1]|nr:MAG: hypothetical protein CFH01_01862 [Alphaproteobacteria bacterium MarineAlpha2_Bin1]